MACFGPDVVPLSDADALAAFRRAWDYSSPARYGLNETAFAAIERLDVDGSDVRVWLAARIGVGELLLVFGCDEVFRVSALIFLDRWQDMFCPSRDDVIVLPVAGKWALFYSHEDEFEFGRSDS